MTYWSDRKGTRRLRRASENILDRLALPDELSIKILIDRLSRDRGRPIRLLPAVLGAGLPCGMWLATDTVDFIIVESSTSPLHQDHIIAHELAHMLCRHSNPAGIDSSTMSLVFPDLDPQYVRDVLGRTSYSSEDEQAAEMVASLILKRITRPPLEPSWPVPVLAADTIARIDQSLKPPD
ncbi:hypothetical protein [Streptomyces buecherae]|uniref:hypothetical protein n=1 Tax=Streptomyces buecherae TaxID=2763006 RepID=UPI00364A15A4